MTVRSGTSSPQRGRLPGSGKPEATVAERFDGMSDDDVGAIVAHLRTLEPVENAVPDFKPSVMGRILLAFAIKPADRITAPVSVPPPGPTPEYGDYLANHVSPRAACHTPHVRGVIQEGKLWSGGFDFNVDGDIIYSANLTRDVETGIGDRTENDFVTTIRTGVNPDGIVVRLPIPWPQLGNMTDDDLRAIRLHIQTVPAISNVVPENEIKGS